MEARLVALYKSEEEYSVLERYTSLFYICIINLHVLMY